MTARYMPPGDLPAANVVTLRPRGPVTDSEIAQLAATDFAAWEAVPDECRPSSLLKACDRPAYLALALMTRPKAELIALLVDIGVEQQAALAAEITGAADKLRSVLATLDGALARLAVASAAIAVSDWRG